MVTEILSVPKHSTVHTAHSAAAEPGSCSGSGLTKRSVLLRRQMWREEKSPHQNTFSTSWSYGQLLQTGEVRTRLIVSRQP